MDTTTELILGFGRVFKAVREREGLTQKELADGMGVSLNQVKKYEQENLEAIGPNGFSISIFAKLVDFLDRHPKLLFSELLSYTGLTMDHEDTNKLGAILANVSKDKLDALLDDKGHAEEPFGNNAQWALEMAANLSRLSDTARAKIGVEILQALISEGVVTKEEVGKQIQDLFAFSLG